MRIVSVFATFLLAGCAVGPTMGELESQAMLTGNWAEVERRERTLARRQSQRGLQCPAGYTSYCADRFGDMRCGCLQRDGIRVVWRRP
jgi:hypothetical protein